MSEDSALPLACVLCGAALPATAQQPFCAGHLILESADRASFLSPPVLSRRVEGAWHLFMALSQASGGRFGDGLVADWLAVYQPTRAVRWFSETEETTVWRDLLREPPPTQSAPRPPGWGAFITSSHSRTQILLPGSGPLSAEEGTLFAQQVAAMPLPLYGLPAGRHGLHFTSHNAERSDGAPWRITWLEFANRPAANADPARTARALAQQRWVLGKSTLDRWLTSLWLKWIPTRYLPARNAPPVPTQALRCHTHTTLAYDSALSPFEGDDGSRLWQVSISHNPFSPRLFASLPAPVVAQLGTPQAQRFCLHTYPLLYSYASDRLEAIIPAPVEVQQRSLTIVGAAFNGTFLAWGGPYPLVAFTLDHADIGPVGLCLEGAAYGIPLSDLGPLLEQLVVLNNRPDLVAQYQQAL